MATKGCVGTETTQDHLQARINELEIDYGKDSQCPTAQAELVELQQRQKRKRGWNYGRNSIHERGSGPD